MTLQSDEAVRRGGTRLSSALQRVIRLLAVGATVFLAACKIEVTVQEGGIVSSEDYVINAGQTVVIDVSDLFFEQTFTAQAAPGYEFSSWLRAPRHFCGNTSAPCELRTGADFASGPLASILASDQIFFLTPTFVCVDDAVCGASGTTDIAGRVGGDDVFPNATVTATVNGVAVNAVADSLGAYVLQVPSDDPSAFLKLEATVLDSSGAAHTLINLAGPLGRLGPLQPISPLTTAKYALLLENNGGAEPMNATQLEAAETTLSIDTLIERAILVDGILQGIVSLPSGAASLQDLLASDAAVQSALLAGAGRLDTDASTYIANNEARPAFDPDALPAMLLAAEPPGAGFVPQFGEVLAFDTATTGRILGDDFGLEASVAEDATYSVDADALVFTSEEGFSSSIAFEAIDRQTLETVYPGAATEAQLNLFIDNQGIQAPRINSTTERRYRLIADGAFADQVIVEEVSRISWEPFELNGVTVQLASTFSTSSATGTLVLLNVDELDGASFASRANGCSTADTQQGLICPQEAVWGANYRYDQRNLANLVLDSSDFSDTPAGAESFTSFVSFYGDIIRFNTDGSLISAFGDNTASWTVEAGKLIISYPDGWTQTVTILTRAGSEYGVLEERTDGTTTTAFYGLYAGIATSLFEFTEMYLDNPDGSYWNNSIDARWARAFDSSGILRADRTFGFSFDNSTDPNSGFVEQTSFGNDSQLQISAMEWRTVQGGGVEINRNSLGYPSSRYWFPVGEVSQDGDRQVYVVEFESTAEFGGFILIPPRLRVPRELERRTDYVNDPFGS